MGSREHRQQLEDLATSAERLSALLQRRPLPYGALAQDEGVDPLTFAPELRAAVQTLARAARRELDEIPSKLPPGRRASPAASIAVELVRAWRDAFRRWPMTTIDGPFAQSLEIVLRARGIVLSDLRRVIGTAVRCVKQARKSSPVLAKSSAIIYLD